MKKTIVAIGMILLCTSAYSFATNECDRVTQGEIDGMVANYMRSGVYKDYHQFMPVEAFKVAMTNLLSYCVKNNQWNPTTGDNEKIFEGNFPESPYIFDHLFDVTMRRLDAETGLAYNLAPDPMALKWRTAIKEIATSTNGSPASITESTFAGYRSVDKKKIKNIGRVLEKYNTTNTGDLTLAEKYETVCEITRDLYSELQPETRTIIGKYFEQRSFFRKCVNMVRERVKRESSYVKVLMTQKSSQFLDEATKAYTKKHFVEEKLMGLMDLMSKVKDVFQTIVQQAAASKSCSK